MENKTSQGKILDLGCGKQKLAGAIGIDRNPDTDADILHDLTQFPYPFADDAFDEVYCDSILEHLEPFFEVMEEIHRITVNGGIVRVKVPYYTSFDAFTDPTHTHFFTSRSFDYFREEYRYHYYTTARFAIMDMHVTFLKLKQLGGLSPHKLLGVEWFANHALKFYEAFLAYIFPAHILSVTLKVIK
ncbi:methyltransferase domain-containing protein [candidate division KSB3 bacterium]|jgi:SAM-dependent methyltransferase|uniref:Methyltransferase domain-containing protein n=1 Tax=candidate division KSB3 bacterium TaxID=2044937 RepID=A0A9D5JWB0_9BACT|nr:methyltransferase domain-containing protein [candidate division KSB3 bacterium]MBD3325330.1 methyltransferase domain-containing protein [candidate division KSB3 bacterium]